MGWQHLLAAAVASLVPVAASSSGSDAVSRTGGPTAGLPVQTLEREIEELTQVPALPPEAIELFGQILNSLPARVKVHTTENYYYFWLYRGGVRYAGNFRLGIGDRDNGIVHFTFFRGASAWQEAGDAVALALGANEGVRVRRISALAYEVSFRGKAVVFELNDLARHLPPAHALGDDESFIGPVYDDSALQFFLVFNRSAKTFLYVLDETSPVRDEFFRSKISDRIEIGERTGFAFYRDDRRQRRILIGVYEGNAVQNNFFDGPFDQLPDNFIRGERLRDAILSQDPDLRGKIDRFGIFADGQRRVAIVPYLFYTVQDDLGPVPACISAKQSAAEYYACFADRSR